ncbi:MAG: 50S ribosomal protein L11 methyltransferase [Anaerolineales bacterium]|nr:50S ribosomal protein L11 methyltransferase [Anaerolineales bacterium]
MNWLEISLTVTGELAESVADVLARFAPNGVMTEQGVKFNDEEDEGTATGPITVRAYLEVNDQLEETRQKVEESLFYLGMIQPVPTPIYRQIADQNWMEAWRQHYKPILIGERLLILPAWLENPDPKRIPIKIDPGMAFGTGTHPTTQLCLELMEENADLNGIGEELILGQGSVGEILAGQFPFQSAPLVAANILAPVLIRLFDAGLADLIQPNGEIILSGILDHQAESVMQAGQAKGLKRGEVRQMKDWVAVSMTR